MSLWLGQLGNHASRIDNKLDCCCCCESKRRRKCTKTLARTRGRTARSGMYHTNHYTTFPTFDAPMISYVTKLKLWFLQTFTDDSFKGASSRFAHVERCSLNFQVRRLQSSLCHSRLSPEKSERDVVSLRFFPRIGGCDTGYLQSMFIFSILDRPCSFMVHLSTLMSSGLLQFKINFVRDQTNSKYRDWAPLGRRTLCWR